MKDKSEKTAENNKPEAENKEEESPYETTTTFGGAFEVFKTNPDAFYQYILPRMKRGVRVHKGEQEPLKKPGSDMPPDPDSFVEH